MTCKDCFTGTLRGDVTPSGREEKIHGLDTYVARSPPGIPPLGTVVVLSDAFGWKLRNTRALADAYARRAPCLVYVPDVMAGHSPPESFMNRMEYRAPESDIFPVRAVKHAAKMIATVPTLVTFLYQNRYAVIQPRVNAFMRAVRTSPPEGVPDKLGVAGFCWGGLYTIHLTHDTSDNTVDGRPVVDCAFTAHPTWVEVPGDVQKVVQPLSVINGEDDAQMGKNGMEELCRIIGEKNAVAGREVHQAVVLDGAKHGFAVRGDRADPLQKERGERSEEQAVAWFQRHFRGDA